MKDTDYTYAVAYTRTLENRMLKRADYEALISAHSLEEGLRILSDKGYGGGAAARQSLDGESLLKREWDYAWNEVANACPADAPFALLLYSNDFHNLKTILKAVFSGVAYQPLMLLEPCTLSPEAIHRAIADSKLDRLPDALKQPAQEAYRILAREGDGQLAEIILDTALFSLLRKIAKSSESDFLMGWVDISIAVMDMKIALRGAYSGKDKALLRRSMLDCRQIYADDLADAAVRDVSAVLHVFEQSGFEEAAKAARKSVGGFERWCDNKLIGYLQTAKHQAFGFEPILAFLMGKQFELGMVRMILSGLRGALPADMLRERLRDLYA